MASERPYEFRRFLNTVHLPNLRNSAVKAKRNETEITDDWTVLIDPSASPLIIRAAADLRDYLFTSMDVSIQLKKAAFGNITEQVIRIGTENELAGKPLTKPESYDIDCTSKSITIRARDERGAAQACYYLEDVMSLREAPLLKHGKIRRSPVFSHRMVHSGWQLDTFPDAHLNAITHAGMNAILIFTKDVNTTPNGYVDFNDLIERAASYGIDVYFYSYLISEKHPDDSDAAAYYRNTYGKLFRSCPGAKGVILVGESCGFPSHDPHTTGINQTRMEEGIRPSKPDTGYWPCSDYPEWLDLIKNTIRKESPQADIVFWTYNFGYAPEKDRLNLISRLPRDITLLVTYEMFEPSVKHGIRSISMDYTISLPGPGKVFAAEAAAAKKRGLRLYTMSNTGGMTWDFGVIPYVPVPFQWSKRHSSMIKAHEQWGLTGLMESHHYGFYPSIISELAKWCFWEPAPKSGKILHDIAVRDYGKKGARHALKAWRYWSDSCGSFIPSNEDQYGPARIGPSYPLIFHPDITRDFRSQEIIMPASPHAFLGHRIVKTFYHPFENSQQSSGGMRYPIEIRIMKRGLERWNRGITEMEQAVRLAPENKRKKAEKMLGIGKFISHSVSTIIHLKQWWLLNERLKLERSSDKAQKLLDQIELLAKEEIRNAEDTIPLVESDSRLGWEPTMEYMTDRRHLEWKIQQVKSVLKYDIPQFREIVKK